MNSSLSGTVALCGNIDSASVIHFFPSVRIVPWASNIVCLITDGIVGEDKWKVQQARTLRIPIRSFQSLIPSDLGQLWVDKYAPTRAQDIIGNDSGCKALYDWLLSWTRGPPSERAVLITGPPGIGKTTAAHLLAKHLKYKVIEMNASCVRNAPAIRDTFAEAMGSQHVGKQRVLVMDEVDGMSSGDRGGIAALAQLLKTCTFPVICIANERGTPRLRPLVAVCLEIKFSRPTKTTIAKVLMDGVVKSEKLTVKKAELEDLCERNGNDIRQILNFLQMRCGGVKDELLRVDAWNATGRLFGLGDIVARTEYCWVDHSMVPLMVAEGYLGAAAKGRGSDADKLGRCVAAADWLGNYDMLDKRIHRTQAWGLLPSAMTAVAAAAGAAGGPAPFQIFPTLLGKMSKRNKHRRLYSEMSRVHRNDMHDTIGVYRQRLYSLKSADTICTELQALGLDRDAMFETLPATVFTGDEWVIDTKLKGDVTRKWKKLVGTDMKCETHVEDEEGDYDSDNSMEYE